MRLITIIGLLILLLLPQYVMAKEWRFSICYGKDATEVDTKFRHAIRAFAAATFHLVGADSKLSMKARSCVKEPPLACYANSEAIFCREEPLALVVRTSAWLAAEATFMYLSEEGAAVLNLQPKLSWVDALLLADAERDNSNERFSQLSDSIMSKRDLSAGDINAIYSLVTDLYLYTNKDLEPDSNNKTLAIALRIYRSINEYAFAFLLGHEAYHFNGNSCPIANKPAIQTSGVWDEIYKLQLKNGLFDNKVSLDKHELNADLCGFSWIGKKARQENKQDDKVLVALNKRLAVDLLASPILTGVLNEFDVNKLGSDAPVFKVTDGYLYPQSRLVLVASTLRHSEKHFPEIVKICNDTAKAMVAVVQAAVQNHPKSNGMIPNSFMSEIAPGVEVAWKNGTWKKDSFACRWKAKK